MSVALFNFESSIKDAEELLAHFDANKTQSPPANLEVLKRAGLVMALTAWETYIEDLIVEVMKSQLKAVSGSFIGNFVSKKLALDLKSFHNPTSDKTKRLFEEYMGIDVTQGWHWANYDVEKARTTLNQLISKRGDAVHRSKSTASGNSAPHLIRREELEKAIRFVKDLVKATDSFVVSNN